MRLFEIWRSDEAQIVCLVGYKDAAPMALKMAIGEMSNAKCLKSGLASGLTSSGPACARASFRIPHPADYCQ
jgi:hypothetical protein